MKEEIQNNLENPGKLERMYRDNKPAFRKEFNTVFPEIRENPVAQVWYERLNFETEGISWGGKQELIFVLAASVLAGCIAKIPAFTSLKPEFFYPRNLGFVFLPLLAAYFSWKQHIPAKKMLWVALPILASVVFINFLPENPKSDTFVLSCIHLPLFLWSLLGFSFVGYSLNNNPKRLEFLRYNGDLVVMTALILIAGAIMTGLTIGLFSLIKIHVEDFYSKYIVVWGLSAAPIVGTWLVQTNPQLVNKVSPVIAKLFTPLVLITLVVYLFAMIGSGKDPYNDREFLLIFNGLLIGVMALIFFSVAGTSGQEGSKFGTYLLFALSLVTICVNGIALSAILFRISEWGITPNRMSVLGGNLLILINLIQVAYRLFKAITDQNEIDRVERSICGFLPVYSAWTILVTFLFPLIFGFK
jgi:hypothetical protein